MIPMMAAAIAALLVVIAVQWLVNRKRSRELRQVEQELIKIVSGKTSEKLLVFTDDRALIQVLMAINNLLEQNRQIAADYMLTEQSMKRMLSNISHDLKTPLTVVLGYLETLNLSPDLDETERRLLLSRVYIKANEVLELIRRFFDLARLESGDTSVELTGMDMNDICSASMLAFYDTLTAKGFEVVIDIPEKPLLAWGSEEAMNRILNNLISNAIRHGGEGQTVGLALRADDSYVYVEVWDRGKGIDELNQSRVFERMFTLDDSRNRTFQGSGLGLTITKRLAELQGGTVIVSSKPYEKTVFTVKLRRISYSN